MILEALDLAGLTVEDLDILLPHQAGQALITAVAKEIGMSWKKVFCEVEKHSNTGSASVLIALAEANLSPGQTVALAALGGGLSWGAAVLQV